MLRHILVPLDGSQLAEKAVDTAQRIIDPRGKITLLTALQHPQPPLYAYPGVEVIDRMGEDAEEVRSMEMLARDYMERVATNIKLHGVHTVNVEIYAGSPADVIVERAHKLGVEAIVMSTHGRSGLSRVLFGSITLKVLSETPCPVVVVPNREQVRVEDKAEDPALGLDTLAPE